MGRTIAGEHFYGPKSLDAVDIPPGLGALCLVTCERRDGGEADLGVVDRAPEPTWRRVADEGQQRAWRDACDGRPRVWYRLYGADADARATHEELAAALRSRLAAPAR